MASIATRVAAFSARVQEMASTVDRQALSIADHAARIAALEGGTGPAFTRLPVLISDGTPAVGESITIDPGDALRYDSIEWTLKLGPLTVASGTSLAPKSYLLSQGGTLSLVVALIKDGPNGSRVTETAELVVPTAQARTVTLSNPISQTEGSSGTRSYVYTITRSDTAGSINVPWTFSPGSTAASDFAGGSLPTGGTVAIADGQPSGSFTIVTAGDTSFEPDETFTVSIIPPSGWTGGARTSSTGTIVNDDPNPGDLFAITSPKTYSQPGGSTHYQQITTDREGVTFGKLPGADADLFTLSAGIVSLPARPYASGGKNSYTCTIRATAPDGDFVDFTLTVNVTSIEAAQSLSDYFEADFSGAPGTSINDVPGWNTVLYNGGTPPEGQVADDIYLVQRGPDGTVVPRPEGSYWEGYNERAQQLFDPGMTGEGELVFAVKRTAADAAFAFVMLGNAVDVSKYLMIYAIPQGERMYFRIFVGAANSVQQVWETAFTFAVGDTKSFRLRYRELTKELVFNGSVIDLSAHTFTGRAYGFASRGTYGPSKNVEFSGLSFSRASGSLTVADAPLTRPGNAAVYSLRASGILPTRIQYQLRNIANAPVTDWTVADTIITGDAASSEITATIRAPAFSKYSAVFRVYNDTSVVSTASLECQYGFNPDNPLAAFSFGVNASDGRDYDAVYMRRDWGYYCEYKAAVPDWTEGAIKIPWAAITGTGLIEVPAGITLRMDGWAESRGIESLTPDGPGRYRYVITGDSATAEIPADTYHPYVPRQIRWSGGVFKKRIKVTPDNLGTGDFMDAYLERGLIGTGVRTLDLGPTNAREESYDLITLEEEAAQEALDPVPEKDLQVPTIARCFARKNAIDPDFKNVMVPLSYRFDDAMLRRDLRHWRDYLPAHMHLIFEFGNELWGGLGPQAPTQCGYFGVQQGFWGSRTDTLTNPNTKITARLDVLPPTEFFPPDANGNRAGIPNGIGQSPAMSAGEYLAIDVQNVRADPGLTGGRCIVRAKVNVPAGGDINTTNFERVVTYDHLIEAGWRWISWRFLQYINICKEVFGAQYDSRVKWAMCWQKGPLRAMDTVRFFQPGLDEEITFLGTNAYVYDGLHHSSRTDISVAELIAAYRQHINETVTWRRQWDTEVFAAGKIPLTYEGGFHPNYYAESPTPQYKALIDKHMMWTKDPAWAGLMYDMIKAFRDNLFGMYFEYKAQTPIWGAYYNHVDTFHPKATGLLALLNGEPRPG